MNKPTIQDVFLHFYPKYLEKYAPSPGQAGVAHCIINCKTGSYGAQSVINYLGKYTHRIAISNHRLIRMDENTVSYYVKDYREKG